MAQQCAICGAQVNMLSRTKLKDGNFICSKCMKLGLCFFAYPFADIEKVKAHHKQVERGKQLWDHFFVPRLKPQDKSKALKKCKPIFIAEDIGLMAIREVRSVFIFFNRSEHFCVYRIADLSAYNLQVKTNTKIQDGKTKKSTSYSLGFLFENVDGLNIFEINYSKGKCKKMIKYLDGLFGIKTKTKGALAELKNSWNVMKDMKSEGKKLSSLTMEDVKVEMLKKSSNYREGDRTRWIEKADKALSELNN